jgi:hypothetical protein
MSAKGVLRILEGDRLAFFCPACNEAHVLTSAWGFNGNYDKPTFTSSVSVTNRAGELDPGDMVQIETQTGTPDKIETTKKPVAKCHSQITDGRIEYYADSTHALAGHYRTLTAF